MTKRAYRQIISVLFLMVFIGSFASGCGKSKADRIYLETEEDSGKSSGQTDIQDETDSDSLELQNIQASGTESLEAEQTTETEIYVQLCGAVNQPGVYRVESSLRIFEVIEIAGGVTGEADTDVLNMARPVVDEMKIYVPTKDEVLSGAYCKILAQEESDSVLTQSNESGTQTTSSKSNLVNLNHADLTELMTLPGIGEAKAKLILQYREENGAFTDISELMNISGIKQAAFDKIKDYITV